MEGYRLRGIRVSKLLQHKPCIRQYGLPVGTVRSNLRFDRCSRRFLPLSPETLSQVDIIDSSLFNTSGGTYINPLDSVRITNSLFFRIENDQILEYGNTTVRISDGAAGLNSFGADNMVGDPGLGSVFRPVSGSRAVNAGAFYRRFIPTRIRLVGAESKGDLRILDLLK